MIGEAVLRLSPAAPAPPPVTPLPLLKLIHTATPDTTKLSCLCRVCVGGVNWILQCAVCKSNNAIDHCQLTERFTTRQFHVKTNTPYIGSGVAMSGQGGGKVQEAPECRGRRVLCQKLKYFNEVAHFRLRIA